MTADPWRSYTVEISDELQTTAWVPQPHLICRRLSRHASETIDSASLLHRYGEMRREGETALDKVDRLDLIGKFVRIKYTPRYSREIVWVGYVVDQSNVFGTYGDQAADPPVIESGDTGYTAYGLEWFLARFIIRRTRMSGDPFPAANGTPTNWIERGLGYNTGYGDDRQRDSLHLGNRNPNGPIHEQFDAVGVPWRGDQVLQNLCDYYTPLDSNNAASPVIFEPAEDAAPYLSWFEPQITTDGRSTFQVLNDLISRRRGLVWWLEFNGEPFETAKIKVDSMATDAINLPGGDVLPAASSQVALFPSDEVPEASIRIQKSIARQFDLVRCRGARRTSTFSVTVPDNAPLSGFELTPGWTSTLKTGYEQAASPTTGYGALSDVQKAIRNDQVRRREEFERVFRDFVIRSPLGTQDGGENDFDDGDFTSPRFIEGTNSVVGGQRSLRPGLRVNRYLPMRAGYDYTDATNPIGEQATTPDDIQQTLGDEMRQPFVVFSLDAFKAGSNTPINFETDVFRFGATLANGEDEDEDVTNEFGFNVAVAPLSSEPGISVFVRGGMPHSLSDLVGSASPIISTYPSRHPPEISYRAMIATVCCEWDSYCEGIYPATLVGDFKPVQELIINVGERARFDYLTKGAVIDLDNDGKLKRVDVPGAVRDDRQFCERVARLAFEWYSKERGGLTLSSSVVTGIPKILGFDNDYDIGTLITTVGKPPDEHEVNATVTTVVHDLENGQTTLTAGFAELDFVGLV